MEGYIYITTNLVNGKKYIGQHKGTYNKNYIGTGKLLIQAIKKYGKENFTNELICYCESREELERKEIELINQYGAVNNPMFYNLDIGGRGGILYERRDKEYNPFFGKSQTNYQKQRASEALKGKKKTVEHIAKLPQNQKGYKRSDDFKSKVSKKVSVLDTTTNKQLDFSSIKELCEKLNISRTKYDNCTRKGKKVIVDRYILTKEENKYARKTKEY